MLAAMRRLAALVVILALAAPAGAETPRKGRLTVVQQPAKATPLRGMQGPVEAPAEGAVPEPLAMTPLPATRILATQAQAGDPGQCRLTCARNYYFCLAADDAEICGPDWGQCRAACGGSASAGGAP
jgi:hypothetical protein